MLIIKVINNPEILKKNLKKNILNLII
jgi:hypothetical protein